MGYILTLTLNLTLQVKVDCPQNNRDLNQGVLHLWSKVGDPSLNGWWVIVRTNLVTEGGREGRTDGTDGQNGRMDGRTDGPGRTDGRTDGLTDGGNDNTRRPKLASGKSISAAGIGQCFPTCAGIEMASIKWRVTWREPPQYCRTILSIMPVGLMSTILGQWLHLIRPHLTSPMQSSELGHSKSHHQLWLALSQETGLAISQVGELTPGDGFCCCKPPTNQN